MDYQNDDNNYKKLHKSHTDKFICGIGEYLNLDPTLVRLVWVLFSLCGASGILAYIVAAIIMP